jgi:hypothetical protein
MTIAMLNSPQRRGGLVLIGSLLFPRQTAQAPGREGQPRAEGQSSADPSRIVVQQPAPTVRVDQASPQVTVQQPQPQVDGPSASARDSSPGVMTGKPLIESDRVEGTAVYDRNDNHIGSIKRLMIEKKTGQVAYTVMSFGGFLGIGEEEHTIPWSKLDYDTRLGGFRTDITEEQLRVAPTFYRDRDYDWSDRVRERELHDYWRTPYYWGV